MRQILQMNKEQIDFHRLSYVQESYQMISAAWMKQPQRALRGVAMHTYDSELKRQSIARTKPTDETNATRDDRVKRRPEILVSI